MYLLITYSLSTLLAVFNKVDSFLLPCPFKYLTGIDCPGCGFQRSFLALLRGNWQESFHLYPPTLLFLASAIAAALSYVLKWNTEAKWLKVLYFATGFVVVINYAYKIITHQLH